MNLIIIISVIFSIHSVLSEQVLSKIYPTALEVENLQNPLAVDVTNPRLSWRLGGFLVQHKVPNNLSQSAYQIVSASNPEDLFIKPDLWNTGKIRSNLQTNIKYEGKLPQAGEKVYWSVRVWDQHNNVSDYAKYNFWGTKYDETRWTANWISVSEDVQKKGLSDILGVDKLVTTSHAGLKPVVYLRKTFSIDTTDIKEATAYVTAKGLYNLFVNDDSGMTVAYYTPVLTPGWTDYNKSIQYQVYNVTKFIRANNTIGVMLGTGWYSGYIGFEGKYGYYGAKKEVLLELHIVLKNGSKKIIRSDNTWKASTGRLVYSDLLQGELQYENKDLKGWLNFNYDDSKWSAVVSAKIDKNVSLIAERSKPTVELENVDIQDAWESSPGVWVYDFGKNFAGYVSIKLVNFTSSVRIQVRHAEVLNSNGSINTLNLGKARAIDTYFLNDVKMRREVEVLKPHFTYHGFRYAEVTGLAKELDVFSITGVRIGIREIFNGIETSNPMVNTLMKNIQTSHLANFISVPTDCPQRDERLGRLGDAQLFAHTAIYNGNVAGFYTKWLRDVREAQFSSGRYSMVAPRIVVTEGGGPVSGDAGVIITWHVYRMYGDLEIVRDNYAAMQGWINFIWTANPTYIWINNATNNMGDWSHVNENTPESVVSTAFFAYDALLLSRMAKAIGKQSDSLKYRELHANISKAFVEKFVNKTDGKILGDSQTAYSLAVAFELLPSDLVPKAVDNLVANVKRHNWHLTTGFVGVGYLLPVLSEHGHDDIAYKLLLQTTYPSWGFMIENNATSIWEEWNDYSNERGFENNKIISYNHYAFGAVGRWLYQYMAGIDTDNEEVGFQKIIIKPHIGLGVNYTAAWYYTAQGLIRLQWKVVHDVFQLQVKIPVNSKATITLPFLKEKWSEEINSGEYSFNVDLK